MREDVCGTCGVNLNGGSVLRYDRDAVSVVVTCWDCDLRRRVGDYQKDQRISTFLLQSAYLFASNLETLNVSWMQGDDRREQREALRGKIAKMADVEAVLREVHASGEAIAQRVHDFDLTVWRAWMRKYYKKAVRRGHTAEVGGVTLLIWGAAGRVMTTIEGANEATLTVLFDEDGWPGYGVSGNSKDRRKVRRQPLRSTYQGKMTRNNGCLRGMEATKEEGLALLDAVIKDSEAFRKGVHPDDEVRLAGL